MTATETALESSDPVNADGPAVIVEDISVAFGSHVVLDHVSLTVPKGSITAVVGPSGCGKTTLLRTIAGLEPVTAGRIEVGGTVVADAGPSDQSLRPSGFSVTDLAAERRSFGLVPQEGALFPHLSVAGNVAFGLGAWWRRLASNGIRRTERSARVDELLAVIGLTDLRRRRPATLSGGQRQRVALARALAPRPAVIGLDEPFSALDAELRVRLRDHVRQAILAEGASGLLVTHDREEAMAMADLIVVLIGGRVRQIGSPSEVYLEPADSEVAQLFGDVILVDGTADGQRAHTALGALELRAVGSGAGTVVMRPGDLEFDTNSPHRAVVEAIRSRGDDVIVTATVAKDPGCRILLRAEPEWSGAPGDTFGFRQRRAVHFLPTPQQLAAG